MKKNWRVNEHTSNFSGIIESTHDGLPAFSPNGIIGADKITNFQTWNGTPVAILATASRTMFVTLSATTVVTLPTIDVKQGDVYTFITDSSNFVGTLNSSNGALIATIFPSVVFQAIAKIANPTTPAHWHYTTALKESFAHISGVGTIAQVTNSWTGNGTALFTLPPGLWVLEAVGGWNNSSSRGVVIGALATNGTSDNSGIIASTTTTASPALGTANISTNGTGRRHRIVAFTPTQIFPKSFMELNGTSIAVEGYAYRVG